MAGAIATLLVLALGAMFEPFNALLVPLWAWWSKTPWRDLGFVRPRSWVITIALGVLGGAAFKLAMKALVMPLFGAWPLNPHYQYLAGNTAALPSMLIDVIVGAGIGEESVYRGFFFNRLGKWLGESGGAKAAMVAITALFFGALHYPGQGLFGAEQATIVGLVFGAIYAKTRQLPGLMIAHASFDITAVALIYFRLEAAVAHSVFR